MGILGGLTGGLMGLGQSLIDRKTSMMNIQRQGAMNTKLQNQEFQNNLDMWNRQNQYNSPAAQMARFKEGGLNPNLMYGQGSAGNATQMPRYQAPEIKVARAPMNIMNTLGAYQDTQLKQAQIDNVKAQRNNTDADTVLKLSEGKWADQLNRAKAGLTDAQANQERVKNLWNMEEFYTFFKPEQDNNGNTIWLLKPEMQGRYEQTMMTKHFDQPQATLGATQQGILKSQADAAAVQILTDIRGKEKEFLESGGKFFNPILQALRLFMGR